MRMESGKKVERDAGWRRKVSREEDERVRRESGNEGRRYMYTT